MFECFFQIKTIKFAIFYGCNWDCVAGNEVREISNISGTEINFVLHSTWNVNCDSTSDWATYLITVLMNNKERRVINFVCTGLIEMNSLKRKPGNNYTTKSLHLVNAYVNLQ